MNVNKHILLGLMIVAVLSLSRLIPHPPNFTPILGMAVFSGAIFGKRYMSYLIPIAAMLLSDLYLGFHASMPVIYFSIAVCVLIGTTIETRVSILNSFLSISLGVVFFFLITNFMVWYGSGMYELSISGLMTCYLMGLPFLQNTFISSILYGMGAFLIYDILNKRIVFNKNR